MSTVCWDASAFVSIEQKIRAVRPSALIFDSAESEIESEKQWPRTRSASCSNPFSCKCRTSASPLLSIDLGGAKQYANASCIVKDDRGSKSNCEQDSRKM